MTGSTILLLIVCAVVGFLFWKVMSKNKGGQGQDRLRPYDKDELRIENVEAGAVIHLSGVGPDYDEFDVKIIAKHTYRQGESSWYELEGDRGEDKVWIDMEEDDELELSITLKKLKLHDIGIEKKELDRIDDEEKGQLTYDGETYYYEDSDPAVFYRYSDDKITERFYYWDFETDSGDKFISIERWSDGSYDVCCSEKLKSSQITVYSLK